MGGVVWRVTKLVLSFFDATALRKAQLARDMQTVGSPQEWERLARELDAMPGSNRMPDKEVTKLYDLSLLKETMVENRKVREAGDVAKMMFMLRGDLYRSFGNITNKCARHRPSTPSPRSLQSARAAAAVEKGCISILASCWDSHHTPGLHPRKPTAVATSARASTVATSAFARSGEHGAE